jgi:hypothetical protein
MNLFSIAIIIVVISSDKYSSSCYLYDKKEDESKRKWIEKNKRNQNNLK